MVVLPQGITGFGEFEEGSEPPAPDESDFLAYCHAVALQLGGKVVARGPQGFRNFIFVTLELQGHELSVLMNAYHPIIAFAEPVDDCVFYPSLTDATRVAEEFQKFGCYQVLERQELDEPISEEAISKLADAELHEMRYWQPKTIGELLFNSWD